MNDLEAEVEETWFVCEMCFGPMLMSGDEYEEKFSEGLLVGCQSCEGKPREEAW